MIPCPFVDQTVPHSLQRIYLLGMALLALVGLPRLSEAGVDFQRDIEPLLSHHCYECHGPTSREGGLRLTSREQAFQPGDFGVPVITPGSADASLLLDMLESNDPQERMPKKRPPLEPDQIRLLRQWIDEGATWPTEADAGAGHWAYRPIQRPRLAGLATETESAQKIDDLIRLPLVERGLAPAPRANPAKLVRRVHFDLTGLPPPPDLVTEFVADPSDTRYANLVEHLLGSPQFGEYWATPWLDLARYADSTGFMSEAMLSNWPYRDWVVQAINDDMPFDQFTIEQLAGDLLPDATPAQKVATGFHRAAPLPLEAGVREEEARITQVLDRVNTTGTVWLGSTLACAQCHDHKFDPISQEEYFGLLAFFNNTALEAVSKDGMGGVVLQPKGPRLRLPHSEESKVRFAEMVDDLLLEISNTPAKTLSSPVSFPQVSGERIHNHKKAMRAPGIRREIEAVLMAQLDRESPSLSWRQDWLEETRRRIQSQPPIWETLQILSSDGSIGVKQRPTGWTRLRIKFEGFGRATIEVKSELPEVRALKLTVLANPKKERIPPFPLAELEVQQTPTSVPAEILESYATAGSPPGTAAAAHDGDLGTAWFIRDPQERRKTQSLVLVLEEPLTPAEDGTLHVSIGLKNLGASQGRNVLLQASEAAPRLVGLTPHLQEQIRLRDWVELPDPQRQKLQSRALRDVLPEFAPALAKAHSLAKQGVPKRPVAHVMVEQEPRVTRIFERGDPHVPGREVRATTPAILHPFRPTDSPDRLDLARWIVAPDNPLTARVTVNRWWGQLFGRPLVDTPEDFGIRGSRPSHPDLLDFLASELIGSGWRRKEIVRQMVLSETYKQSTIPTNEESLRLDPNNLLLSRAERVRLPAEAIRDNALQIAGLLEPKLGGPAVFPPQPAGVWMRNGLRPAVYSPSTGTDRYRRGLYTVIRRTSPYPSLVNFDATDRTACRASRRQSNTPLQALNLLNDEVFREAALAFAQEILSSHTEASNQERMRHAFLRALSRPATQQETQILLKILADRDRVNRGSPKTVDAILAYDHFEVNPEIDRVELANWFSVTRILLNLDEAIHRG